MEYWKKNLQISLVTDVSNTISTLTEKQPIKLFSFLITHIKTHLPNIKLSQKNARREQQSDTGTVSVPVAD